MSTLRSRRPSVSRTVIAAILLPLVLGVPACGLVLGLSDYRNCQGGDLGVDAPCGGGGGGGAPGPCESASDCPAATDCASPVCDNGTCSTSNAAQGKACGAQGGQCDGDGNCVECFTSADCVTDSSCVTAQCGADHACVTTNVALGQACSDHNGAVCDGSGTCVECNKAADCPTPSSACTLAATCDNHKCSSTNAPVGTPCTDHNGHVCDDAGQCFAATQLAAGRGFTCALTTLGNVKCWGGGALGNGNGNHVAKPVDVKGLEAGVTQITAGYSHVCAITGTGGVMCWGGNQHGELGNGTMNDALLPVAVTGLDGKVLYVGSGGGSEHTCAVVKLPGDSEMQCWGKNDYSQLGDGTMMDQPSPVRTIGLFGAIQTVSTGVGHTCTMTTIGSLQCWGQNNNGAVGDGTFFDSTSATGVVGMDSNVLMASAAYGSSCAIKGTGELDCWGYNAEGEIGDGTIVHKSSPTPNGINDATFLAMGESHSCAIRASGQMVCWGFNGSGQIGNGTTSEQDSPASVVGITNAVNAAAGSDHTCAILADKSVMCWGEGGSLGDGMNVSRSTPVAVKNL